MLKGIRGVGNRDVHRLPVIRNTPRESELVEQIQRVLDDPRFEPAFAIVVADHGAYIWGDDVMEAKRHTEVYHFLFEATVARHDRQDRHKEEPMSHAHQGPRLPTCSTSRRSTSSTSPPRSRRTS